MTQEKTSNSITVNKMTNEKSMKIESSWWNIKTVRVRIIFIDKSCDIKKPVSFKVQRTEDHDSF